MSRWQRHLEGWQLVIAAVGVAISSMVLVLPRAVVPRELPLPTIDRVELARAARATAALAREARTTPLPYPVRAVGESIRAFGDAEFRGDPARGARVAGEVLERVATARKACGERPLLALRAVQAELFVRAVTTWAVAEEARGDVVELGGGFVGRARKNGWVSGHHVVLDDASLAQLFVTRWNRLTGLSDTRPYLATLNELRLYYRTLLEHPDLQGVHHEDRDAVAAIRGGYVVALSRQDPDYPVTLASGIIAFQEGHHDEAAELFASHLASHPGGPWRLRAQNYWVAARERRHGADDADALR